MKVLMFGWEFPPHISGGLGTACYGMTKGLANQGIETIFVVPKAYGDEDESAVRIVNASDVLVDSSDEDYKEFWKKITYMEIGSNLIPYVSPQEFARIAEENRLEGVSLEQKVTSTKFNFSGAYGTDLMAEVSRYALVAAGIAKKSQFDLIHAHDWLTYSAGIAAKNVTGKPLVVHMHATEFDRSGVNVNQNIYDIERKGMEEADRVITVSNLTRTTVIEKYGINPDKVFTVHNAVEPTDKEVDDVKRHVKEKVVTFLGRLTQQKGPEYFIEAASLILKQDQNVRFVMAGSGDLMNKMIKRVAQLKIATKFHFTGFLKGADVDKMFLLSDVFVMPSVSEPFGIVPLEAMRSNVPVVISKQSGVAEILKHALKVDFWDVHGMADSIYGLLHYDSLRKTFQKYGKDEVDSLKWDNAAFKIVQVYDTLFK
ncbi:MAG: glycosyltransferase family 4 protein [Bacteroidales bacterium]|nr:glycosyltransferase family 4 protein [Bacteroidales bacterium]